MYNLLQDVTEDYKYFYSCLQKVEEMKDEHKSQEVLYSSFIYKEDEYEVKEIYNKDAFVITLINGTAGTWGNYFYISTNYLKEYYKIFEFEEFYLQEPGISTEIKIQTILQDFKTYFAENAEYFKRNNVKIKFSEDVFIKNLRNLIRKMLGVED